MDFYRTLHYCLYFLAVLTGSRSEACWRLAAVTHSGSGWFVFSMRHSRDAC